MYELMLGRISSQIKFSPTLSNLFSISKRFLSLFILLALKKIDHEYVETFYAIKKNIYVTENSISSCVR